MAKDQCEIKTRYLLKQGNKISLSSSSVHVYPISHWKVALVMVAIFISITILSAFVFAIFFPLLLMIGISLGIGFLWVQREFRKSEQDRTLAAEYTVDNGKAIQETDTDYDKK